MTTARDQLTWRNWAGNEQFAPGEIATPTTEHELEELTLRAVARGRSIGLAGAGHSFTPIVECTDLLIKIEGVNGIISSDPARHTVDVLAGTTIEQMGQSFWDAGLSLKNQGDIDAQTIAGAVATGTHGSGIEFGSFSSTVRAYGSSPAPATCSTSTKASPTSCTPPRSPSACSGSSLA